jgi:hypothetical protein
LLEAVTSSAIQSSEAVFENGTVKKGMTGSKLGIPQPRRRTSHAKPDYSTF